MPGIADAEVRARVRRVHEELDRTGRAAVVRFAAQREDSPATSATSASRSCTDEETAYVFVPRRGETTLVIDAEWDLDRARAEAQAGEIILHRVPARALADLVAGRAGPGVAFDDAGPMLDAIKLVKWEAEIPQRAAARPLVTPSAGSSR
jgi:hypothetical protein